MKKMTIQFSVAVSGLRVNYKVGEVKTMTVESADEYIKAGVACKATATTKQKGLIISQKVEIDELGNRLKSTNGDLKAANNNIETLTDKLGSAVGEVETLTEQVAKLTTENEILAAEIDHLNIANGEFAVNANVAHAEIEALQNKCEAQGLELVDINEQLATAVAELLNGGVVDDEPENDGDVEKTAEAVVPPVSPKTETRGDGVKSKAMPKKKNQNG